MKEALKLMNNEGVSSLAVVDNQYNVVGNISNVDVKVTAPHCYGGIRTQFRFLNDGGVV